MFGKRLALACIACLSLCMIFLNGCGGIAALSVALTPSAQTVDGTNSVTITASVTNDHNAAGVSWAVSGGGALSNTTTTSATYTAPAATSSSQSITVTATSIGDTTKTASVTLTVPAKPTVSTTSQTLVGTVGAAFSIQLQGSGGIAPYKNWAVSSSGSALPSCLTLSSAGVLTTASGLAPNATCAGTYGNIIFTFSDSGTPTALTATSSALTITITAAPAISFASTLPAGSVGTAYSGSVTASGGVGAITYAVASGALPPDLTLNASTGAITGTPKAADAGTVSFQVSARDAYGDTSTSGALTLTIAPATAITFNSAVMPTGTYNVAYSGSAAATGGAGTLTYSLSGGSLPPDLSLNTSTGAIAGTPSKATDVGTFNFIVKASDSYGDLNTQTYQLVVSYPGVNVTSASLPVGYIGSTYTTTTMSATGGTGVSANYTWAVVNGTNLPAGLSLSPAGVITGSPTGPATGPITFQVMATDTVASLSSAATQLTITINSGISINAITLPTGYVGGTYPPTGSSSTMSVTGGNGGPYTWSWTAASGSSLPAGLSISTGGVISGKPTTQGSFSVVVTATDSAQNTANVTLPITVARV